MSVSDLYQKTYVFLFFKQTWQQTIKIVADLRLAIVLILVIALSSISGTLIEQGESLSFYQENYPQEPALFGFLTWNIILILGLNHVYSTWWFLALLVFLGTSLVACTFTRQFSAFKAARNWNFYQQPRQFQKLVLSGDIDNKSLTNVVYLLRKRGYKVFQNENSLYARKGIVGKIGPVIVHAAMLIILGGAVWGIFAGFFAQEMIASGSIFEVKNILEAGPFSKRLIPTDWSVKVNKFWIDYTPNGDIKQFYSDLSIVNNQGEELKRKTIFVNKPLRYDGVTFYQASWGIAGVKVQVDKGPIFKIPIVPLNTQGQGKIWGTWIPTKPDLSEGISLLTKDLQGTVIIYDKNGNLYSAIRPGMTVNINGVTLKVCELIASTGLQIKADPGIPLVYTGFGLLMLGVIMSYISHSQVWVLQQENRCYIGGKTNRAHVSFEKELVGILDELKSQKIES
ncbi:cytochrome c biogenesis protein [Cyanobacterium sp. uoEpiScrs1]|uniref:cytochrome c biogenesis protein n=1 Tax=Cyanobacterium sp. uoEpiScrs1 TaxID=2976343 RepID=UPI002269ED57|nr:cytochrome c biogenesis protein [Cyanobacterium sp. uoEpiScrs1]